MGYFTAYTKHSGFFETDSVMNFWASVFIPDPSCFHCATKRKKMILSRFNVSALLTHIMMMLTPSTSIPEKFILPSGVCDGKILCDKIPNYPIDEVRSAIRSEEEKHIQWFGTDPDPVSPISARLGETEFELCASRQEIIYPQAAQTPDGLMKVIVNDGEVYRQGLRIEVCGKENSECQFSKAFPNGYRTKCVQKYVIRQMVAIGDDGKPVTDHFRIPSCCACAVTGPIF